MKTHSIILSTDMVEAILAGRKTKLWELFSPRPAFNAELDHVDILLVIFLGFVRFSVMILKNDEFSRQVLHHR